MSQEEVKAVPLLAAAAAAQSSGPHLPPLSPPGERDTGVGHRLDVRPPLHGILGVPAGTEVPFNCLAPKLLLFSPEDALLTFPRLRGPRVQERSACLGD